ncbi:hypothetical protein [Kitasatospora sp. GP82]|uniref:hypothetical protein n=1 Tax=Kitasatospora sp. GP82 TaxID=3035089 RepID=UPI00247636EB|nr:hypothetical protein [Kitasatospora sp. GP82]MDH6129737.1 hypothetical protein [Kitasatospora sp. GP82]
MTNHQPPTWAQPTPPAPPKPGLTKAAKITLSVLGGIVIIGGCNAIATGGKGLGNNQPVAAPAPQTTASSPAKPVTPSASTPSPSHATAATIGQQIHTWYTGGGQTHITNIGNDAQAIANAAATGDTNAVANACGTLKGHVRNAQAYPPIPDPESQQHWGAALDAYKQAAADCITAASTNDAALLTKSGDEIGTGSSEITQTSARINEINASGQ